MITCQYTKIKSDSYGTNWKTSCGKEVRCEAPIEVGFSFDPLPNANGKFCSFCGKEIVLKEFKKS